MTDAKTNVKVEATGDVVKAGTNASGKPEGQNVKDLTKADDTPVHADVGKGSEVTAAEQKLIDEALGDAPEISFEAAEETQKRESVEVLKQKATVALRNFHKLNRAIPATTPDEHFIWGIAENRITVGDLRNLLKVLPPLE